MATRTSITMDDLDRVGVSRHAEAFETLAQCRARFEEIKAQLQARAHDDGGQVGICVCTLRTGDGVPPWTVAVLATAELTPRIVPRGRPVDLPDEVWAALLVRAYAGEREQKGQPLRARRRPCAQVRGGD
jgi:hypothetical protein